MKTYGSEPGTPRPDPVQVGISEFVVADADDQQTLKAYGLGSCVAVALYDPDAGVAALAHVMLPNGDDADGSDVKPGKYADTAIRAMLRQMVEQGASYTSVQAKIAGGSDMFQFESFGDGVGKRNAAAAKEELDKLGVPLEAEETGGSKGRTVEFDTETMSITISTADGDDEAREL